MVKQVSFNTVIKALLDTDTPFPPRYLHRFSDIEPQPLSALMKAWPRVSPRRKHALLEDLEELAEHDTLLSFDNLARTLLHDTDAQVRILAIRLLWECQDKKLVPIFLDILNHDSDSRASATAATALGLFVYLGELDEIPPRIHHEVEDNLLAAFQTSKDPLIQRRALESLGTSSRPEVPGLIETAFAKKDPGWVISALFAMGRSSDRCWEKQVLAMLKNSNEAVRIEAIQAAGEIPLPSARPILLNMLEDEEDNENCHEIIWALSKIGGEGVRECFEELLDNAQDEEEAEFLEDALANLAFTEDMQPFSMYDYIATDDTDSA